METVSVHLPFETITNCRDMAGIVNKEGRIIRSGLLFRSGNLHKASVHDIQTLQNMGIQNVVDLRTEWEVAAAPDHLEKSWNLYHTPVLHETDVSQLAGSQKELIRDLALEMLPTFEKVYELMVSSPQAIATWKSFFSKLLDKPGSYLWHCTEGKDRTGMAAILLLNALDVQEDLILEDYLQTNLYVIGEVEKDTDFLDSIFPRHEQLVQKDMDGFLQARREYYEAAKKEAVQKYGGWKGYLTEAIGLQEADFTRLKDFYMENPQTNL